MRTDYQTKVGREQGGALTGSIFSEVPVVTIEMVVLSDAEDAAFIKTEEGQQRMAESIADGVTRFVAPERVVSPRKRK
jgi:N-acetylmuramoyl-L-alanine amidase